MSLVHGVSGHPNYCHCNSSMFVKCCLSSKVRVQGIVSIVTAGYFQMNKCQVGSFCQSSISFNILLRGDFVWGVNLVPPEQLKSNQSSKCWMLTWKHRLFDLSCRSLKPRQTSPIKTGSLKRVKPSERKVEGEGCSRPPFSRVGVAWPSLAFPSGCTQACRLPPSERPSVACGDRAI